MKKSTSIVVAVLLASLTANAQIIFQDTFDDSTTPTWGQVNNDLVARQAGGTTSSTYSAWSDAGADPLTDSVIFSQALLMRDINTVGDSYVDLNTDFGAFLSGQEWVLSYSQFRTGSGLGDGWSGIAVGVNNPSGTPFATGFGFFMSDLGHWAVFNGTTVVEEGLIGYNTAGTWYNMVFTVDEAAGTVSVDFADAASGTINLGTFTTSFGAASGRFVGLRNHVNTLVAGTYADMYTENLQIEVIPSPEIGLIAVDQLSGTNGLAVTWATDARYGYTVESKTHLTNANWATDRTGIVGTGGNVTITTAVDQLQCFYRIVGSVDPNLMEYEAVVFCSDLQPRSAQLLFTPVEIRSVQRANRSQVFEEGIDYTVDANGLISLPPGSQIPVLDYYAAAIDPTYYRFADIYGTPFFSPGGVYKHDTYDVVVTYTYDHATESLDELAAGHWVSKLTNSLDRLRAQQPLNITFFGDSITFGAQASSLAPGAAPFAPAYPLQIIDALKARFGYDQINYANKAVGGMMSDWGLQEIQQVIDTAPDLVVLAFGMNDASGGVPSATYKQNTEGMIQALRASNPAVSIVLVAEFSPNPEMAGANYSLRAANRDALYDLYSTYENMAFVDVGAVSRQVAARKKFQDFSGNNINHPNDFLHKIYADLILNVFGE